MNERNKILKLSYNSPTNNNITKAIEYIESISGKELKISYIRQNLFKTNWSEKEIKTITKCHLQASKIYLSYLISKKQINEIKDEIKMVIAEVTPYISETDKNQDTSFILISSNTLPSFIHQLNAQELFYNHNIREDYRNNYNCDILVLYALRLTLEKRINGIVGIDYILNRHNQPISLSRIIKIVQNLRNIEFSSNINWESIKSVNKWLNHFMHRNLRPHPWSIHQAFQALDDILNGKPYRYKNRVTHSWFGATVVKNQNKFEQELENTFNKEFPNCHIKRLNNKELLIFDED